VWPGLLDRNRSFSVPFAKPFVVRNFFWTNTCVVLDLYSNFEFFFDQNVMECVLNYLGTTSYDMKVFANIFFLHTGLNVGKI